MADIIKPYKFLTRAGIAIPQYAEMREAAEAMFRDALGQNIDLSQQTAVGRLCEAYATMMMMCAKTNAQNAGGFNIKTAIGGYLDNVGALFGVERLENEGDNAYRNRILASNSVGTGYAESVRNAVSKVEGVDYVQVYENPFGVPRRVDTAINVMSPHSILVYVHGGDDSAVANAIYRAKSAGCDTIADEYFYPGNPSNVQVDVADGASTTPIRFGRKYIDMPLSVEYTVSAYGFDGDENELIAETNRIIKDSFSNQYQTGNGNISTQKIVAEAAAEGIEIRSISLINSGSPLPDPFPAGGYVIHFFSIDSITPKVEY